MQEVDLVVSPEWIVPMAPREQRVLEGYSAAVQDGRLLDLLPTAEVASRYIPAQHLSRPGHVLLPGLVNAHTHAAMTLLRGYADDLRLEPWLKSRIMPAEKRWVSETFVRDGTELAIAEMLLGGITCFKDMYFYPDVAARVAARLRVRACVGLIVIEEPSSWAQNASEYLSKDLKVHDEYKGHPLISFAFSPHSTYTVSEATLVRVRGLADQLDLPVHMHLHETAAEVHASLNEHGERPLARLEKLGFVTPLLQAVHMTQLTAKEIDLLSKRGVQVIHCPESNLKMASGICPVSDLQDAGVTVALGTDGAASNNDLDMFSEVRTAALVAKVESNNATALPAYKALEMATLSGARTLGLGDSCGSLEAGKWADMITVNLETAGNQPVYDPVSQLVYCASREHVSDVWIAGRQHVASGRLTQMSESDVIARAKGWRERIGTATTASPEPR